MRSMREHVHDAGGAQRKAVLVYEDARISRQASRVAGDVQHDLRAATRNDRQDFERTGTRRIEQYLVVGPPRPRSVHHRWLSEIAGHELDVRDAVQLRVAARASDQSRVALDAEDMRAAARQRQREIAEAAKQVEHLLA